MPDVVNAPKPPHVSVFLREAADGIETHEGKTAFVSQLRIQAARWEMAQSPDEQWRLRQRATGHVITLANHVKLLSALAGVSYVLTVLLALADRRWLDAAIAAVGGFLLGVMWAFAAGRKDRAIAESIEHPFKL